MNEENNTHIQEDGLYLKGVVISTRAHAFESKRDQRIQVVVNVELSCGNDIVTWSRYVDPQDDEGIRMEGRNVVGYPAPEKLSTVTLKVLRTRSFNNRLSVTSAELLETSAA